VIHQSAVHVRNVSDHFEGGEPGIEEKGEPHGSLRGRSFPGLGWDEEEGETYDRKANNYRL